jgi:hypothetical protein
VRHSSRVAAALCCLASLALGLSLSLSCDTCDAPAEEPAAPETASLSLLMPSWLPASPPSDHRWEDTRIMWWYDKDRDVREQDIFPNAPSSPGESFILVLETDIRDFRHEEHEDAMGWAGIEQLLSSSGENLSKYEFFEVWIKQKQGEGGRLLVDAGDVSEDFYRPWREDSLHTEDKDKDGELSYPENTGLDGVPDGMAGDDPLDDYSYDPDEPDSIRYAHINGLENDPKRLPDTEDLDHDGDLDKAEVHYRFSIDFSDTAHVAWSNNDWVIYRIPLSEAVTRGGRPIWSSIKYVRIFFTGVQRRDRFQIARLAFVDSSWVRWLEEYYSLAHD